MASNGAYPVLGTGVTVNPGASLSMFTALPLATPAPGASNTVLLYPMVLHGSYSAPTGAVCCSITVAGQDASRPNVGACLQRLSKLEGTEVGAVNASQARPWPRSGRPSSGVSWLGHPGLMPPPSCLQGNAGPRPQEDSLERSTPGLPPTAKSPPDNSCNPNEVSMENFRLWQHYSPLPEAPFSQSPDTEALSASFIPVLRSLARRKPTMTLEEGLWQAMWEWQRTSNFDRMIFYEMAEKFLEFEAEEEMQMQKAQWMKGTQSLPPPAPPRLEPQGPPAPEVVKQPGTASHIPTGATAKAKGATGGHCPHTQWWGQGPPRFLYLLWVSLAPGYSLPRKLMSSSFCFQVEAVIHSPFLEELLSPDPQMDLLALSQELEKEEELTLAQLVEKRLLSLKEKRRVRAAPGHGTACLDSSPSKFAARQGAERDAPDPQQGVGVETCPPQMAAQVPQGQARVCTGMARSKDPAVLLGCQDCPGLRAARPTSPLQDHRPTCPSLGTKDTLDLPGASPVKESHRLAKGSSEERELPGMVYVVGSHHRLRPWRPSQSPVPSPGLLSLGGRGPQGALQSPSAQRRGLSPAPSPVTKSKKRLLFGSPSPAEKMPDPGPGLRVSGEQSPAPGLGGPSQSQKRRGGPLVSRRKKTRHCSQ
uniref:Nuclear Testis protein N-terminal domain-containing protein n=1 Tax=Rhinopithecus bieti TaxID=61621 RepID=A0A2K6M2L5_RHIBE